ncbi:phosphate/phosphite/phosphonate ABC transporter substrate-binding protein [bacterium]|nr:phosphate/phosphite/phosphonate ABC transporter substrate-binding protein [bacterium]
MTRRTAIPRALALALVAALAWTGALRAQEGTAALPLRIGFNGGESPGIIRLKANAFAAFLEERSGLRCQPLITETYSQLIRAIAEGKVDFAFLSPLGYVTASQVADAELLLKSERGGRPFYWSVILVRRESGIRNLGDLKGKRFAFTHLGSTSGYVVPLSALLSEGIDPDRFFASIVYAGGHSAVIRAILAGEVDAGATFADDPEGREGAWTAEEFIAASEAAKLMPIFFSPPIPGDTFVATARMRAAQPAIVAQVKGVLLAMGESNPGRLILGDLYNIDNLVPAEDADYEVVRSAFAAVRNR